MRTLALCICSLIFGISITHGASAMHSFYRHTHDRETMNRQGTIFEQGLQCQWKNTTQFYYPGGTGSIYYFTKTGKWSSARFSSYNENNSGQVRIQAETELKEPEVKTLLHFFSIDTHNSSILVRTDDMLTGQVRVHRLFCDEMRPADANAGIEVSTQ